MKKSLVAILMVILFAAPAFAWLQHGIVRAEGPPPKLRAVQPISTVEAGGNLYVVGLWDHDDNIFTPPVLIEGLFDVDSGEAISWDWY